MSRECRRLVEQVHNGVKIIMEFYALLNNNQDFFQKGMCNRKYGDKRGDSPVFEIKYFSSVAAVKIGKKKVCSIICLHLFTND